MQQQNIPKYSAALHRVSSSSKPPAAASLHSSLPPQLTLCQESSPCPQAEVSHWISWSWPLPYHRRAVTNNSPLCLLTNPARLVLIPNASFLPHFRLSSWDHPRCYQCSGGTQGKPQGIIYVPVLCPGCHLEIMVPLGALTRWEVTASESIPSMDMTWSFVTRLSQETEAKLSRIIKLSLFWMLCASQWHNITFPIMHATPWPICELTLKPWETTIWMYVLFAGFFCFGFCYCCFWWARDSFCTLSALNCRGVFLLRLFLLALLFSSKRCRFLWPQIWLSLLPQTTEEPQLQQNQAENEGKCTVLFCNWSSQKQQGYRNE